MCHKRILKRPPQYFESKRSVKRKSNLSFILQSLMTSFIGHFHPVLVHLPIGILLLAILFEFLSRREKYGSLTSAVELSWLLGGIAAAFSCVTGYMLSLSGEYEGDTLTRHQYLGIAVAVVSFLAFYLKKKIR